MLEFVEAVAIADIVANDPEASKRIDSNIDAIVPASWGIAGSIRNWGYVALFMGTFGKYGDASEPEFANRVCTGISNAASDALTRARRRNDARVRRLVSAEPVSRVRDGTDHTAVQLKMLDGQDHVVDWHATLDAGNPMLFPSTRQWLNGQGGIPLKEFSGWK